MIMITIMIMMMIILKMITIKITIKINNFVCLSMRFAVLRMVVGWVFGGSKATFRGEPIKGHPEIKLP